MSHRTLRPSRPIDVARVLAVHRRGPYDPAFRVVDGAVWRTSCLDGQPATLRVAAKARDGVVEAEAWGPGAEALLDALPTWLGEADDPEAFRPAHDLVRQAWRQAGPLLLGRTGQVMESLVPAVLEQKVTGVEAYRSWAALLREFGTPAPGPAPDGMRVAPDGRRWAEIPSWAWHRAGVTPQRSRTIVRAARLAAALERTASEPTDVADRRLRSVPGIGVWTSAEIRQRTHGDPDAVSVGDANLSHHVAFALAGERRASDERMLELLQPYVGQRHRAAMLITMIAPKPPRRAPRAPIRDYRSI